MKLLKFLVFLFVSLNVIDLNFGGTPEEIEKWDEYKILYNKTFRMEFREDRRRKAFEENLEKVKKHNEEYNAGKHSFKLRTNNLADLSSQQYLRHYVRLINSAVDENSDDYVLGDNYDSNNYPSSLDWRDKGFVTSPSNQKSCGSCYAFAVTHSIEGQIFKKTARIVPLSTQQIVDCSVERGNHGCAGGSLRTTMKYLESSGGLMREAEYPYTATHNKCAFDDNLAIVNITSWAILPSKNENVMKAILNEIGPLAVSINASLKTFQLYSEGVYDDAQCSSEKVNHAMLLLGYTEDYWILKNWWGIKWGERGYMKMKRGVNMCGVSNYAAYAIV